jgi:hypothetical protein
VNAVVNEAAANTFNEPVRSALGHWPVIVASVFGVEPEDDLPLLPHAAATNPNATITAAT